MLLHVVVTHRHAVHWLYNLVKHSRITMIEAMTRPQVVTLKNTMTGYLLTFPVIVALAVAGCDNSMQTNVPQGDANATEEAQMPTDEEEANSGPDGLSVNVPGVEINVDKEKGISVKAPGTDVSIGEDGVDITAPGVDIETRRTEE